MKFLVKPGIMDEKIIGHILVKKYSKTSFKRYRIFTKEIRR